LKHSILGACVTGFMIYVYITKYICPLYFDVLCRFLALKIPLLVHPSVHASNILIIDIRQLYLW